MTAGRTNGSGCAPHHRYAANPHLRGHTGTVTTTGTTAWRTLRRTAELPEQPWANGRGATVELISPDESAAYYSTYFPVDGRWRLTVATLDEEGPFSPLPGMDRFHTPLAGVELTVDGVAHRIPERTTFAFDGGADTALTDLPYRTRAVNLTVDRGSPAAGRLDPRVVDADTPVVNALAAVALDGSLDLVVSYRDGMGETRDFGPRVGLAVVAWTP